MLGALIGAGITAATSLFGANRAQKQAEANAKRQEELQREFAQNAIQWKAADAEKAGVSKLYGLGANTTSYAPVNVGGSTGGIPEAGQAIGRAIDATQSGAGRAGHLATQLAETQLEGAKLDNDIKRQRLLSDVATRTQAGQPPPMMNINDTTHMMPGQGNSLVAANKLEIERKIAPARSDNPHASIGVNPEVDVWRSSHGYTPEVPQNLGEAQESQPMAAAQWFLRNKILPTFDTSRRTYPYPAPEGQVWQFNPLFGEYTLRPSGNLPAHDRYWYEDQLSRYRNNRGPR